MRLILTTLLMLVLASAAIAQSAASGIQGAAFSGFKTYWVQKRVGCRPMLSLSVSNTSSGEIGPIALRLEVFDQDKSAVFAVGETSIPAGVLQPGLAKTIAIGGDHDITSHECLGDMHETAFSSVHFVVRLTARAGQGTESVELVRNKPMSDELLPAQE